MKNANQIRQLLQEHCKWCLRVNGCAADLCNITAALALLSCGTCGGMEIIQTEKSGHSIAPCIPCPDCQSQNERNQNERY